MTKYGVLVCALALGVGCGDSADDTAARAEEGLNSVAAQLEQATAEATEQLAAAEPAIAQANEAAEQAGGEALEGAAGTQGLAEIGERLGAALAAAGEQGSGTPCEQAYDGMMQMIAALSKGQGMAEGPPRADFIAACGQLPADAQQCMVPAHAMQNAENCQAIMARPEVQAKVAELQQMRR